MNTALYYERFAVSLLFENAKILKIERRERGGREINFIHAFPSETFCIAYRVIALLSSNASFRTES